VAAQECRVSGGPHGRRKAALPFTPRRAVSSAAVMRPGAASQWGPKAAHSASASRAPCTHLPAQLLDLRQRSDGVGDDHGVCVREHLLQ
jgi:hypothetical protein